MKYDSTSVIQSALDADVQYVVLAMTKALRIKYDLASADSVAKLQDIYGERDLLRPEMEPHMKAAKESECTCKHDQADHDHDTFACLMPGCDCRTPKFPSALEAKLARLRTREITVLEHEINPTLIRSVLADIKGLEVDGVAIRTADDLLEKAPEEFAGELAGRIRMMLMLSAIERKNSARPTTSGEWAGKADGPTPSSTVLSVEPSSCTSTPVVPALVNP